MLKTENMSVAFGVSLLCYIQAELRNTYFQVRRYLGFSTFGLSTFGTTLVPLTVIRQLDPKNFEFHCYLVHNLTYTCFKCERRHLRGSTSGFIQFGASTKPLLNYT